jgi:hypothetical protein
MRFLVKVRVNPSKLTEFGQKLQRGELDRSLIRSETYCMKEEPAVGYSVWEANDRTEFETVFSAWKVFYSETTVSEVVSANEAMVLLMQQN